MNVLFLIPGLISFYFVSQRRIRTAFLSVYLPCLLLLPSQYSLRIPHLPPLSAAEYALIPLGMVGVIRLLRGGSFALMDLLVAFFVASVGLSEILHALVLNDGILSAVGAIVSMAFAYVVGRQFVEPELRLPAVRRIAVLVLLNFIPGFYEWRMQQDLYAIIGIKLFGLMFQHGTWVQVRNGHGRFAGAFDDAEIAGIIFAMTFCLSGFLVYLRRKARVKVGLDQLRKFYLPEVILLVCLWMTQSRGPEIALFAGVVLLQIPRLRNVKLVTIVVAIIMVFGYWEVSSYFDSYAHAPAYERLQDEQSSAAYRSKMNHVYAPIAEAGGWTGWGVMGIPHVDGLNSIDNEYLLAHLAWGRLGYVFLLLIVGESTRVLITRAWTFKSSQDRAFAFSMLATMIVLWLSLLTVFMGEQLPQITFLLIGWIQSMTASQAVTPPGAKIAGRLNAGMSLQRTSA